MTPLFALRGRNDMGVGNLGALHELLLWCSEFEQKFILLLPINACGADYSPYNAISSFALEHIYLDLTDENLFRSLNLPRLPRIPAAMDAGEFVNYNLVSQQILSSLREALEGIDPPLDFYRFREKNKHWLHAYSLFKALCEKFGTSDHQNWPVSYRKYSLACLIDDPATEELAQFHTYVQWICDAAWRRARSLADNLGIWLIGDLPFSVSIKSADYWHHPERFVSDWFAGAPPEPAFRDDVFIQKWGQNWGLPLYDWEGQASKNHPWWQQRIASLNRYFHGFRLDHALGFFRVYSFPWPPDRNQEFVELSIADLEQRKIPAPRFYPHADDSNEHKLINLAHGRDFFSFLRELAPRSLIIAEDLGVVPDYVRPALQEMNFPGIVVPHFERLQPDLRYLPVDEYPECSLATWATHDHPPLAALWKNWQERRSEDPAADWEVRCFLNFLNLEGDRRDHLLPPDLHRKAIEKIASSRSRYVCLQLTDAFSLDIRFNVPGTLSGTNWARRYPFTIEDLKQREHLLNYSRYLAEVTRKSGRCCS